MASRETIESRLERYEGHFHLSVEALQNLSSQFVNELQTGLDSFRKHPYEWHPEECSFKMLDSCVNELPTGNEQGVYYGLDFGGTNFRAVRVDLKGEGKLSVSEEKRVIANQDISSSSHSLLHKQSTASQLFGFFSDTVHSLMHRSGDITAAPNNAPQQSSQSGESNVCTGGHTGVHKDRYTCGFTFSFPCSQRTLASAKLIEWTKGFETGRATSDPVENCDVQQLMSVALQRREVPLDVNAVLNDGVGALLSTCYTIDRSKHPKCLVAVILGTGVNACYYERTAGMYGYKGKVINIECGNFDKGLPQTNVDHEVDFASANSGKQLLEKMLSGAYISEICRRTFIKITQHKAPEKAWAPFSIASAACSTIIEDTSTTHVVAQKFLLENWDANENDLPLLAKVLHNVSVFVFDRSAALAAVIIASTCRMTQCLQKAMGGVSVAIDGSLYRCIKSYRAAISSYLEKMLGHELASLIHIVFADDGSGKGAAILSASAASGTTDAGA